MTNVETDSDDFADVDVIDVDTLFEPVQGPYIVALDDGSVLTGLSEDAACRYQRAHRLAAGRDPMTGEMRRKGKTSPGCADLLWAELGDVPVDDNGVILEPFLHFTPNETNREEVWHWFEAKWPTFSVTQHMNSKRRQAG